MLREVRDHHVSSADLRQLCAELERRLAAGESIGAESLFQSHPDLSKDDDAALELIYTEFVAREQLGEQPKPDDYFARFPRWTEGLKQLFQIHAAAGGAEADVHSATPFPPSSRWQAAEPIDPGEGLRHVGNYEIVCEIGRGGMGVVFKARQIGLNRLVALKMILTGADAGPAERARFRAEAESAARLQHSNIVQIYEVGQHLGRPYLSLELVEGGSLEARLNGTPWPAADSARLVETLARAMQHAHQQGVVHRDLKPANILLQKGESGSSLDQSPSSFVCKITDFGLARQIHADKPELTVSGAIVGTPAYMAPEQAAGDAKETGPSADVYALGAILYELLTGRPPFQSVSVLETLEQVRTQEPVPPGRLVPKLPRDIETICLKCLRKEPGHRYASAEELAEDLRRFVNNEPIRARPITTFEKARKWARRRPAVAALLGFLILFALTSFTSITVMWLKKAALLDKLESEHDRTETALASNLVTLAHRDWLASDMDAARQYLEECPPARRGPKWRYLDRATKACLFHLGNTHTSASVNSVCWSPNGRHVAASLSVDVVNVWDPDSGDPPRFSLPMLAHSTTKVAFDPDNCLVSMTWSRPNTSGPRTLEVKRWELERGQMLDVRALPLPVGQGAMSASGRHAALISFGKLVLVDISEHPVVSMINERSPSAPSLTLSADGSAVAWRSGGNSIRVWDAAAKSVTDKTVSGLDLRCLAISLHGRRLALGGFERIREVGITRVLERRTGRELAVLRGHTNPVTCAEFSPDCRRLATASSDKSIIIWDLETGKALLTLRGHFGTIWTMAFSPDGMRLATGAGDGTVRIWDVRPLE